MMAPAFKTVDMALAAFLMCQGYEITVVDPSPTRRAFVFSPVAQGDADSFYRNATVSARQYAGAMRDLKNLIHAPRPTTNSTLYAEEPRVEPGR